MLEKDVGSDLVHGAQLAAVRVWKLHNSEYQRGVLDYLVWWKGGPLLQLELKAKKFELEPSAPKKVHNSLSDIQKSIFNDMAKCRDGVLLATGFESGISLWTVRDSLNFGLIFESHGAALNLNNTGERRDAWRTTFINLKSNYAHSNYA